MSREQTRTAIRDAAQIVAEDHERLLHIWGRRGFWQIKLRWAVAPLMLASIALGRALDFEFRVVPIVVIAIAILVYNLLFQWFAHRNRERLEREPDLGRKLILAGMLTDYLAMLFLLYVTGGSSSPLVVLVIPHVIIAAIQFSSKVARLIAAAAAIGPWLLWLGQTTGWLSCPGIGYRGEAPTVDRPVHLFLELIAFTAILFLTVAIVARIERRFRKRVGDLARVTTELGAAHDKLHSLYTMVCAIGPQRRLEPILTTVVNELAGVMDVPAVGVKLLSEDGKTLHYVAAHGLPDDLIRDRSFHLEKNPLHKGVIEAGAVIRGGEGPTAHLPIPEEYASLGIESALFAPLKTEDSVIGTLDLFARSSDHFDEDADFVELVSAIVAVAIEDARANEEIERLIEERTQFTLQVAHNLRAPLGAALSMLDLVQEGHVGPLTKDQETSIGTIDKRLHALNQTVGDLLTIARTRDWSREIPDVVINLAQLAERTERTFREEAERKNIRMHFHVDHDLPDLPSGADLLDQMMENLVSNAIKYTPDSGEVEVALTRPKPDEIRILVRDTGIGVPPAEQERLFREFFRASNAKQTTAVGTGLGLALVKRTVERHRGRIQVSSEVGAGTTFVIYLPVERPKHART